MCAEQRVKQRRRTLSVGSVRFHRHVGPLVSPVSCFAHNTSRHLTCTCLCSRCVFLNRSAGNRTSTRAARSDYSARNRRRISRSSGNLERERRSSGVRQGRFGNALEPKHTSAPDSPVVRPVLDARVVKRAILANSKCDTTRGACNSFQSAVRTIDRTGFLADSVLFQVNEREEPSVRLDIDCSEIYRVSGGIFNWATTNFRRLEVLIGVSKRTATVEVVYDISNSDGNFPPECRAHGADARRSAVCRARGTSSRNVLGSLHHRKFPHSFPHEL